MTCRSRLLALCVVSGRIAVCVVVVVAVLCCRLRVQNTYTHTHTQSLRRRASLSLCLIFKKKLANRINDNFSSSSARNSLGDTHARCSATTIHAFYLACSDYRARYSSLEPHLSLTCIFTHHSSRPTCARENSRCSCNIEYRSNRVQLTMMK